MLRRSQCLVDFPFRPLSNQAPLLAGPFIRAPFSLPLIKAPLIKPPFHPLVPLFALSNQASLFAPSNQAPLFVPL